MVTTSGSWRIHHDAGLVRGVQRQRDCAGARKLLQATNDGCGMNGDLHMGILLPQGDSESVTGTGGTDVVQLDDTCDGVVWSGLGGISLLASTEVGETAS
jgi:hypothetical protein